MLGVQAKSRDWQLISYKGVSRTAPATPGLLIVPEWTAITTLKVSFWNTKLEAGDETLHSTLYSAEPSNFGLDIIK